MARRKKGRRVHGWLTFDKPMHMTSTQAVGIVKRLFNAQKVGHAGTLDPLATGILPIALGEATKTVPFTVDSTKAYTFTVRWGIETSTDDTEGEPTRTSDKRPDLVEIEACLAQFRGAIAQVPPQFSAVKIAGQRAYDLARDGEQVSLEAREVLIERLEIADDTEEVARPDATDAATTTFEAVCGKGTYVRSLARDIGRALGCFGHITQLRRTAVGPFTLDEAVTLEELEQLAEGRTLDEALQPVESALSDVLHVPVSGADAARLQRGQAVILRGRDAPIISGLGYATHKGTLLALVEMARGEIRPTRVFNLDVSTG
jgi:tRNA pseudouridine55 synthase